MSDPVSHILVPPTSGDATILARALLDEAEAQGLPVSVVRIETHNGREFVAPQSVVVNAIAALNKAVEKPDKEKLKPDSSADDKKAAKKGNS